MEFQVEENTVAECGDLLDRLSTGAGKELVADLEHADKIGDLLSELQRGRQRVKVEGHDQTAAGMSVEGHCFGDPDDP